MHDTNKPMVSPLFHIETLLHCTCREKNARVKATHKWIDLEKGHCSSPENF